MTENRESAQLQRQLDAMGARMVAAAEGDAPAPVYLSAVSRRRRRRIMTHAAAVSGVVVAAAVGVLAVSLTRAPTAVEPRIADPGDARQPSPGESARPTLAANYASWARGEEPGLATPTARAQAEPPASAAMRFIPDAPR